MRHGDFSNGLVPSVQNLGRELGDIHRPSPRFGARSGWHILDEYRTEAVWFNPTISCKCGVSSKSRLFKGLLS